MNIPKPKITVLMPVYNGEKYLQEAIESILNQTFTDFEFLIINDGSTDNSEEIIKSYTDPRIKLINNPENKGLIYSLNKGLNLAKGEYIARMDQDDISLSNRLETQIRFMSKNTDVALIGGKAKIIDKSNNDLGEIQFPSNYDLIKFNLIFSNTFIHSSVLFKKDIIKKIRGYDENYQNAEDFNLWFNVSRNNKVINIDNTLIKYRVHRESIINSSETQKIAHETVRKIIHRNCNYYTKISDKEFLILFNALANKQNYNVESFSNLIIGLKTYVKLFYSYIKKEKLSIKQTMVITPPFLKNVFMFFRWYIKSNLPAFYKLLKKIKKC